MTTTNKGSVMDRANGDLKAGDWLIITEWVGERAFVKRGEGFGFFFSTEYTAEREEASSPNTRWIGNAIEVLAIDYPRALIRVYGTDGSSAVQDEDLRHFECRPASPEFVQVFKDAASKRGRAEARTVAAHRPGVIVRLWRWLFGTGRSAWEND